MARFDHHPPGTTFTASTEAWRSWFPRRSIEPYVLWRLAPRLATETGTKGNLDFKTVGFRWVGKLPANFDYGVEIEARPDRWGPTVWARGRGTGMGYTVAKLRYKPRLVAEYKLRLRRSQRERRQARDLRSALSDAAQPIRIGGPGGWRNIHDARAGVEFKPRAKWTVSSFYHNYWLASATDALYSAAGAAVARSATGIAGTHVGQQLDGQAMYSVSKQVQIGGGLAHMFTGEFLNRLHRARITTFPTSCSGTDSNSMNISEDRR